MATEQRKVPIKYNGIVSSISGDKTIRVEMDYLVKHPKYGKIMKRRVVAHVHDEENQAKLGDRVEICKCRPYSKTKNWRLMDVLTGKN